MSQWNGASRSNYVRITDMPGLRAALEPFGDLTIRSPDGIDTTVCFLVESGEGWPSSGEDKNGNEIEFDPAAHICPFMAPRQVLIMMESGAEKLRYVTGNAQAYHSDGRRTYISIDEIYERAATEFGVDQKDISHCEF